MGFTIREHTADVAVEATGNTLGDAFAAVADGMAAAMCDSIPETGARFSLDVTAEGREALLFDYLDELIYERDVRAVLPVANQAEVTNTGEEWHLSGSARGVPLEEVTARDLKAVTYSDMRIEESGADWYAYVVFDV
jgi:SHS2 domain-containing protein